MSDRMRTVDSDNPIGSVDDPIPLIRWPSIAGSGPRLAEDCLVGTVTAMVRTTAGLVTVHPPAPADAGRAALLVTVVPVAATAALVRVAGELDLAVVDVLSDALNRALSAGRRDLRLDLSGLRFCGCSGLEVLLAAHYRFADAGGGLTLTGLNASMLRLLRLTGLDQVLTTPVHVSGNRDD